MAVISPCCEMLDLIRITDETLVFIMQTKINWCATIKRIRMRCPMKERIMSSHHDPYKLG